jgi:hypothetical protein
VGQVDRMDQGGVRVVVPVGQEGPVDRDQVARDRDHLMDLRVLCLRLESGYCPTQRAVARC